jgi:hypothetical protein
MPNEDHQTKKVQGILFKALTAVGRGTGCSEGATLGVSVGAYRHECIFGM